jgi:CheY-like chemotaxis protein
MKILVVDDDPDFLAVFLNVLNQLGFGDVVSATSGASALEMMSDMPSPVDCFILDIQMPEMNGIELTRRIRALGTYDETPIVMNTVMSDRKHIDAAFQAGATDYLTKPIDVVEIQARLGVISSLVKERHSARQPHGTNVSAIVAPSYGFLDSIPLKHVSGAMGFFAMKNYLKTLGILRAMTVSAVGIQVANARDIYDVEGGYVFGETMVDVANCIAESLASSNAMISYAGGGSFVCLLPRSKGEDPEILGSRIQESLLDVDGVYQDLEYQPPHVVVGAPVRVGVAHVRSPDRIVDAALKAAAVEAKNATPLLPIRVGGQVSLKPAAMTTDSSVSAVAEVQFPDVEYYNKNALGVLLEPFLERLRERSHILEEIISLAQDGGLNKQERETVVHIAKKLSVLAPVFGFKRLGGLSVEVGQLLSSDFTKTAWVDVGTVVEELHAEMEAISRSGMVEAFDSEQRGAA